MNMKDKTIKDAEVKPSPKAPEKKMRQIVIETDGTSIHLVSADVAGRIELTAILEGLLSFLNKRNANEINPREDK